MKVSSKKGTVLAVVLGLLVALIAVGVFAADGAQVTAGELEPFLAGIERGYDISGRAHMVRTASGETLTTVQAWGLAPNTTYGVHVHNAACAAGGGGHYQDVVGGDVDSVNEIWLGFTTNSSGHGNGFAANGFTARPEAQALVIHDGDGARIACADLE